jgi:hypothetical protein
VTIRKSIPISGDEQVMNFCLRAQLNPQCSFIMVKKRVRDPEVLAEAPHAYDDDSGSDTVSNCPRPPDVAF